MILCMTHHSNKHIREVIEIAIERGWRVVKSGGQAHAWGKLYCPAGERGGCIIAVYSTPRNPQNHAKYLLREMDKCRCTARE